MYVGRQRELTLTDLPEKPSILVLAYSPIARDARVLRQLRALKSSYTVTSAGFGASPVDGVEHVELAPLPPYRGGFLARVRYAVAFALGHFQKIVGADVRDAETLRRLGGRQWDLVIANDANTLPVAFRIMSRFGVFADLHEYSPRQAEESWRFRLTEARFFRWILRRYLPRAACVTTVSPGIADEYAREFGVRPHVVVNAATYVERTPRDTDRTIRLVHSAAPSRARGLEVMMQAVNESRADVSLDLYLVDSGSGYVAELRALADEMPRVHVRDAVASDRLVDTLASYDVGVHLLPPINFNHRWALPNKIFDFVQARLGVVVGPSPEMARLVVEHGIGAVTDGFSARDLVHVLDRLTPETVTEWKRASHHSARALSAEQQMARFEELVRGALAAPARLSD